MIEAFDKTMAWMILSREQKANILSKVHRLSTGFPQASHKQLVESRCSRVRDSLSAFVALEGPLSWAMNVGDLGGAMQFDLFPEVDDLVECGSDMSAGSASPRFLCWTKMQAEAGQNLADIFRRKEYERKAGNGVFFWGIGSPLDFSRLRSSDRVDLIFSTMLSAPKTEDKNPESVLVWRKYLNASGQEVDLPPHVLLTSRATTKLGPKKRHYALVCHSEKELVLADEGEFDPMAYRNAGPNGGKVGFSQVTSLLERTSEASATSRYRINFRAELRRPFLAKLCDPVLLEPEDRRRVDDHRAGEPGTWLRFATQIRAGSASRVNEPVAHL